MGRARAQLTVVGSLLVELRGKKGCGRRIFAELTGWSYDMLRNLEVVNPRTGKARTAFTIGHLMELVKAGWFTEDSVWFVRFKEAMERQWEMEKLALTPA
ncbi:MAG: hypothetical protein H5T92_00055 [Synergistales bacterium]|nr:hypothetical protein [Synergistales bacterium]